MLYIVPTPLGNLEDITLRALRILKEVALILAEDTRTSKVLLQHYAITTPLSAYHMHNEHARVEKIITELQLGKKMALISDAGTPGIADPGFLLVRAALAAGVKVEVLPGACALITALVASGFPSESFIFDGFLPLKKGRQTRILTYKEEKRTVVLYESPHRILKTLKDLALHLGQDRTVSVARELTKYFEEILRGSLQELLIHFEKNTPKGEMVLLIKGRE